MLACTSAAGYALPPFVIYDRKTLNPEYTIDEVPGSIYGLSQNGWIDKELFNDWFFNHFLLYAPQVRPLLLLMDGHSTHYCPEVVKEAAAQDVVVFVLPPNTTHCTQPLDKDAFSALKTAWRDTCHQFMCANPGRAVSRFDFARIFANAWYSAMTLPNIINGFKVTGIYLFNRNAFTLIGESTSSTPSTVLDSKSPCPSTETQKVVRFADETYIPLFSPRPTQSVISCDNVSNDSATLPALKPVSSISKHLVTPKLPRVTKPVQRQRMSGRVLTSIENIQQLEHKEKEKREREKQKELNRLKREENRKKKKKDYSRLEL